MSGHYQNVTLSAGIGHFRVGSHIAFETLPEEVCVGYHIPCGWAMFKIEWGH